MNLFQRQSIQSRLEQLLTKQGELEAFKDSAIFQTTIRYSSNQEMRLIKFHDVITCYFVTEAFGQIEDSPSATLKVKPSGQWKYIARYRANAFNKGLKAA